MTVHKFHWMNPLTQGLADYAEYSAQRYSATHNAHATDEWRKTMQDQYLIGTLTALLDDMIRGLTPEEYDRAAAHYELMLKNSGLSLPKAA